MECDEWGREQYLLSQMSLKKASLGEGSNGVVGKNNNVKDKLDMDL